VVAIIGIDAKLIDYLKTVLAPVANIDQSVVERGTIITLETVPLAQDVRGGEDVGRGDLFQQALKFGASQMDAIERLELFAEIRLHRGAITDIGAVCVFKIFQLADQVSFNLVFCHCH
jgi:hypothetical protein